MPEEAPVIRTVFPARRAVAADEAMTMEAIEVGASSILEVGKRADAGITCNVSSMDYEGNRITGNK